MIQTAYARAKELLGQKRDFVWNTTNITADMRGKLIRVLRDYNAHIEIVYLEPAPKTLLKQNANRTASVEVKVIEKLSRKLDPPKPWEAHRIIHVLPPELALTNSEIFSAPSLKR